MAEKDTRNGKGSVMVVGAGIAGIQASLDLADSGYFVYLVDKNTAIGGTMAQLDKTFPTNDCSMCIISPKLVEAGRHLNIEMMTMTEIEDLSGEEGDFTVTLKENPRFIDIDKCTACGECSNVCPVELPSQFDEELRNRKAAFKLYPQAMPSGFAIEKKDKAPCRLTCPAGLNVQGYVQMVKEGKYKESLNLIHAWEKILLWTASWLTVLMPSSWAWGLTKVSILVSRVKNLKGFAREWISYENLI